LRGLTPIDISKMATNVPTAVASPREVQDSEAEYTLEYQAMCPKCGQMMKSVKVIRLLRTKVNFVSTLPRHGRVITCPSCRAILSGELTLM
jgi:hypothetical protein